MQGLAVQQPERDTLTVDDYTLVPAGRLYTLQDLPNAVTEVTDGDIVSDEISNLGRDTALPLPRQPVGEPIRLTGGVIEDMGES